MPFVDTHLHLDELEDPAAAVSEAAAAGVTRLIAMGSDAERNRRAVELSTLHPEVFAAVGHHPANSSDPDLDAYRLLLAQPRVVAVGEVGLDGGGDPEYAPMDRQTDWFASMCDLALEARLPVCVHVREAAELAHQVLRERPGLTGVMHYFALDQGWAERFLELGFHLSFAGLITRATRTELREVVRACPPDRLLLETDAPFGLPSTRRGERQNRPAFLIDTARLVAELRGISLTQLAEIEMSNAFSLFHRLR